MGDPTGLELLSPGPLAHLSGGYWFCEPPGVGDLVGLGLPGPGLEAHIQGGCWVCEPWEWGT